MRSSDGRGRDASGERSSDVGPSLLSRGCVLAQRGEPLVLWVGVLVLEVFELPRRARSGLGLAALSLVDLGERQTGTKASATRAWARRWSTTRGRTDLDLCLLPGCLVKVSGPDSVGDVLPELAGLPLALSGNVVDLNLLLHRRRVGEVLARLELGELCKGKARKYAEDISTTVPDAGSRL